jgi:hypothetical protein
VNGGRKLEILTGLLDMTSRLLDGIYDRTCLADRYTRLAEARDQTARLDGEAISEDSLIEGLWGALQLYADAHDKVMDTSSDLWDEVPGPTEAANKARQATLQQRQTRARELKLVGLSAARIGRRMALDDGRRFDQDTEDHNAGDLYPYDPRQVRRWLNGEK